MTPQEEIDTETLTFTKQELEFACELGRKEIEKLRSQLSTALSEALALRVENERLKAIVYRLSEEFEGDYRLTTCVGMRVGVPKYLNRPQNLKREADFLKSQLEQPTPTGLTDKLLRLVVAAVEWAGVDLNDVEGDDRTTAVLYKAAEALTPEEVSMIEGLRLESK